MQTRKQFLGTLGAGALPRPFLMAEPSSSKFYFAIIADTHIIDDFYKGPEGNAEDTESIFLTSERLIGARTLINSLQPAMEKVFLVGDYFHNYPSTEMEFYFENETRVDRAKRITDGFKMPVHAGFGNHDYDVPKVSRDFSHELFRRKFNLKPYYSLDYRGFKFVHLNNFLGETWNPANQSAYKKGVGSLGLEQLEWFEAELEQKKPTFVFIHYPLRIVVGIERADFGVKTLLKKHAATVQRVVSGHWHRWVDFKDEFGPPHLVMAATRYDEDAYLIVEADAQKAEHTLLNINLVDWNTHFSKPYEGPLKTA